VTVYSMGYADLTQPCCAFALHNKNFGFIVRP